MDLNRAMIIGNVTRAPELRTTPTGQNVCSLGAATNQQWTDSSGNKQQRTEFHNLVAWGKLADICGQYLSKGSKIFAEGRLQTREWETPDGQKRQRTEIILEQMIMLDKRISEYSNPNGSISSNLKPPTAPVVPMPSSKQDVEEIKLDDIPF